MAKWFWQWDINQTITWDDLQVGQRVNFAQASTTGKEACVVLAYEKDGMVVADVPNDMLQVAEEIRAYEMREDPYQTILRAKIFVQGREKPQDYITEQTRIETWEQVEQAAQEAIEASQSVAGNAQIAQDSAESASQDAQSARADAESAKADAESAKADADRAQEAAQSVDTATVTETQEYLGIGG